MSLPKYGYLEDGPWRAADLQALRKWDRAEGVTPGYIAARTGHSIPACDVARWAMLGRTMAEALEILNGRDGSGDARQSLPVAR